MLRRVPCVTGLFFLLLLLVGIPCICLSQQASLDTISSPQPVEDTSHLLTIREIDIVGNKKTRRSIILREVHLKPGDQYTLSELVKKFEFMRKQITNLSLFHEVVVAVKNFEGHYVDVRIQVKERWYLFPLPYFKPIDRNLNQWLVENKGDLDRVNYGVKVMYNNPTGRNDKLRFWLINGYTKQFMLNYQRPYFDKQMRWGFRTGISLGKTREINYGTTENKQAFYKDPDYIRNFSRYYVEFSHRPVLWTTNVMGVAFVSEEIADTVVNINPDYFKEGRSRASFPEFYYHVNYTRLDYIPYPTSGFNGRLLLTKKGFNRLDNYWGVEANGSVYWPTGKKSYVNLQGFAALQTPGKQIQLNRRILGYGDNFLQGYEYYVMDGIAAGFVKARYGRKLFGFNLNIPETKRLAPKKIPFSIYGKIYGNAGYVYDKNVTPQPLNNKLLSSAGIGIDIVSIYDIVFKLEWSFNQIGENGLFLHKRSPF